MIDNTSQNKRTSSGASSSPGFSMPSLGAPPDLFAGFRKELADLEAQEQLIEQRAIQMAAKIEQADSSTMFGGDYSEASQYAQWMTDHLDEFAESTDGIIRFQTMVNELNSYIDTSEEYKKMHFGTASAGPKQGSFTGYVGRSSGGAKPYEKDGYMDVRPNEDYERTYIQLNEPRQLQFDENSIPTLSNRGRMENPFMPQLQELPFEGGFEWMEKNSKGRKLPTRDAAKEWLLSKSVNPNDPSLFRKIVKDYAIAEEIETPLEQLLTDPTEQDVREQAYLAFEKDALRSWDIQHADKKESPSKSLEDLTIGEFKIDEMPGYTSSGSLFDTMMPTGIAPSHVGFDSFFQLEDPYTDRNAPNLGKGQEIIGFNVDAYGKIHVVITSPGTKVDEYGNLEPDQEPTLDHQELDAEGMLGRTMKNLIGEEIQGALMRRSQRMLEGSTAETRQVLEDGGILNSMMGFR
jgi:hypothetical protein